MSVAIACPIDKGDVSSLQANPILSLMLCIDVFKLSRAWVTFKPETVESFLTSVDGCLG